MRIWLLLSFIVLFQGCAGSVRISGSGCQAFNAQIMNKNEIFSPQHQWEKKLWTSGGSEDDAVVLLMRDLLAEKNFTCKQVKSIRYTISQNFMDQVFSIVPFRQRMTIKIELETKS